MNESRFRRDGDGAESGPERTDCGYEQPDGLLDRLLPWPIRSTATETRVSRVREDEVGERVESEMASGEGEPAIVTWHDLLAQDR